ncbi:MAG: beta-galactosidase, partial [Puniceicoccales bacterium]
MSLSLGCALAGFAVEKPVGIYASSGALHHGIYDHPEMQGVLVRVSWSQIEPSPGVFDFSQIDRQVSAVESHGKRWLLAISAGG